MATKTLETLDIRVGTTEQLATLPANPDAIEFNTDEKYPANSVAFDNTGTGLTATDVQAAIAEVAQSGGSGGDYLPLTGGDLTGALRFVKPAAGATSGITTVDSEYNGAMYGDLLTVSGGIKTYTVVASRLSASVVSENMLAIPDKAGTLATLEDLPSVTDNADGTKVIRMGKTVIITGTVDAGSVGPGVATETPTVTLPVTMANNTYVVSLTPTCDGGFAQLNVDYEEETTTSFKIGMRNVGSSTSTGAKIGWMVIGDVAE